MPFVVGGGAAKPLQAPGAAKAAKTTPISMMPRAQELGAIAGMPGAPPKPVAAPTAAPALPQLDGTALANIADYLNKTNGSINADQLKASTDQNAYQNSINQLNQQQPLSDLKIMSGDNARGQGVLGSGYIQGIGNENTLYANKAAAAQNSLQGDLGSLANAIASLQGSVPAYDAGQAAASTARATTDAAKLAPAALPTTTKAKAVPSTKVAKVSARPNVQGQANTRQLKQTGTPMGGLR